MKFKQAGFTLTELLIAGCLSSIVLFSVTKLYLNFKDNYRWRQDSQAILVDTLSTFQIIKGHVLRSGYIGCNRWNSVQPIWSQNKK